MYYCGRDCQVVDREAHKECMQCNQIRGHVTARPPAFSPGPLEETEIALMYSYAAWTESPGAIDVIRDRMDRQNMAELYEANP